jgi:hypothetical protein
MQFFALEQKKIENLGALAILSSSLLTEKTSLSMAAAARAASAARSRYVFLSHSALSRGVPSKIMWPAITYDSIEEWASENKVGCAA